jgi:hypothetical protein
MCLIRVELEIRHRRIRLAAICIGTSERRHSGSLSEAAVIALDERMAAYRDRAFKRRLSAPSNFAAI